MLFLKEVLGEKYEEFKGIIDAYNSENKDKQVKLANLSTGEYVSKAKYDALESEKNNVDTQLKTANSTITALKKDNKDNEALQTEIAGYKTTITNLQAEADKFKKTYAVKELLVKEGVIDPDYVIYKQGGVDKFSFDDKGEPVGVTEIVKTFKEDASMAHLFKQTQPIYEPAGGQGSNVNPFAKETFNLTEQGKLLKENTAQAREMATAAGVEINF